MDKIEAFEEMLKAKLAHLVPGEQTQSAVLDMLIKYVAAVRDSALLSNNLKLRSRMVEAQDVWLQIKLDELTDTEHDDKPKAKPAPAGEKRSSRH